MFIQYPVDVINIRQEFSKKHHGLDLGWDSSYKGSKNQNIKAITDGVVIYSKRQTSGGYVIHIYHSKYNFTSEYGHLKKNSQTVKVGDTVKKGQVIAKMGNTGIGITGNHLHFGLYKGKGINYKDKSKWINPLTYLVRFKDQAISSKSKLKIVETEIVKNVPNEPLLIHNKKNFLKSSIVKGIGLYNGDEVPIYDKEKSFVLCDKYLGYYCSSRYIS